MERDILIENLRRNVCLVTFRKITGELREMRCTLDPTLMGQYEKKTDHKKVANDAVLPVWDLDKNEFRSFRVDTVSKLEVA